MEYLKTMELYKDTHVDLILLELESGNIVIVSCAKMIAEGKQEQLRKLLVRLKAECKARGFDGDSLGTFRVIVTPKNVRIWRER